LQHSFVLHNAGDIDYFSKVVSVGIDADVFSTGEMRECPYRRHFHELDVVAEPFPERDLLVVSAAEKKNLGTLHRTLRA
jgi:hypothetical protein